MANLEIAKSIRNLKDRIFREPNDKPKWLLAPNRVEKFVDEGRPPFLTGYTLTNGDTEWKLVYQLPPRGIDPEIQQSFQTPGGDYRWIKDDGSHLHGTIHRLTITQSSQLEQRIQEAQLID